MNNFYDNIVTIGKKETKAAVALLARSYFHPIKGEVLSKELIKTIVGSNPIRQKQYVMRFSQMMENGLKSYIHQEQSIYLKSTKSENQINSVLFAYDADQNMKTPYLITNIIAMIVMDYLTSIIKVLPRLLWKKSKRDEVGLLVESKTYNLLLGPILWESFISEVRQKSTQLKNLNYSTDQTILVACLATNPYERNGYKAFLILVKSLEKAKKSNKRFWEAQTSSAGSFALVSKIFQMLNNAHDEPVMFIVAHYSYNKKKIYLYEDNEPQKCTNTTFSEKTKMLSHAVKLFREAGNERGYSSDTARKIHEFCQNEWGMTYFVVDLHKLSLEKLLKLVKRKRKKVMEVCA